MNIKRNITLIYIYAFCINSIFILPVLLPYFQNELGLTFQQMLMGEALFAAVVIAMEVPSGWMSDVWSRKGTLIVGCIFGTLSYGGMMVADGFWQVMFFMALMGVGVACNSGTVTSLIYDTLATNDKTHLYQKLEGKRHGIALYSVALAAVAGGILYQYHPKLPLAFDTITQIMGLICACLIVEPKRIKRAAEKNPIHDMMITMKYALHGHKEIAGIIIVATVLFCSTKMFMWTQQPYMQYVQIPTEYFGYIMACGFLFGGLMGHLGHKIKYGLSNRHMIMILTIATCVVSFAAILLPFQSSIVFLTLIVGVWGFGFPFVQNAINNHADPARRATILSTLGLMISLAFIPASALLGWLSETQGILTGIAYLAIQLLVLSSVGFWLWSKGAQKKEKPITG